MVGVLDLTVSVAKSAELLENVQRKLTCLSLANAAAIPVNRSFLKELMHIYELAIDAYRDSLATKEILSLDAIPLVVAQLLKRRGRSPRFPPL